MKANSKKQMAMSQTPDGVVRITVQDVAQLRVEGDTDEDMVQMCRASRDAVTEIVPMTEGDFSGFCDRHGGTPCHPTLAAYPYPRGD